MKIIEVVALFVVTVTSAASVRGSVPIVVATPQRLQAAMKLVTDAQNLLEKGDAAGAKRNVDAALHSDPTFWPALYVPAQIFASQGKYDVALQDCNEALRQEPVLSRLPCCVPTSMLALENSRKHRRSLIIWFRFIPEESRSPEC